MSERLREIEARLAAATPRPWTQWVSNAPFYIQVIKPAPSLSKHDDDRPDYWRVEDAQLLAHAPSDLQWLIDQLKARDAQLKVAKEALEGILSNVALDWYVQQFARDTTPQGVSSGIAARIHNTETLERAKMAFENARDALRAIQAGDDDAR